MGSVGLIEGARGRAGGPSSEGPVLSRFGQRRGAPTTSVPLRLCGFHPVLMRLLLVPSLTLFFAYGCIGFEAVELTGAC